MWKHVKHEGFRYARHATECPLLGVEQTSRTPFLTSAFDPKRTSVCPLRQDNQRGQNNHAAKAIFDGCRATLVLTILAKQVGHDFILGDIQAHLIDQLCRKHSHDKIIDGVKRMRFLSFRQTSLIQQHEPYNFDQIQLNV